MQTSRDIITTLLKKEMPERVGLNEAFWPHIYENSWSGQGMQKGENLKKRFNLDIDCAGWFNLPEPRPDIVKVIDETDEWVVRQNGWGSRLKFWKKKAGTPEHIGFVINDVEIWKRDFREAALALDVKKSINENHIKNYKEAMESDKFVTFSNLFIFEMLRMVLGDQYMLESLLLEPEFIHDFNSIITDKTIEMYEVIFSEIGLPDGMHVYEDLGYTAAAFASPTTHREMVLPYHKKFFGFLKDQGLPLIMHTCGDFRVHIDSIIESGVDCIQAMEAKTGMDVVELAKEYKDDLCFMGNVNIMSLETGDRNKIKEEVLHKLLGMKEIKAPYIFMSDHSIPPTVKLEDYEYMLDLYKDNCMYN
jgi:uroporphyrinogen decarboxylase